MKLKLDLKIQAYHGPLQKSVIYRTELNESSSCYIT